MQDYPFVTCAVCAVVIAILCAFSFNGQRFSDKQSYESITSDMNRFSLMTSLGASLVLLGHLVSENGGKLMLGRKWDPLFPSQLLLTLVLLIPSLFFASTLPSPHAAQLYWPILHIQIIVVIHIAWVFWAHQMGPTTIIIDVYLNSFLSGAAFTAHIYPTSNVWSFAQNPPSALIFRGFFLLSTASLCSVFYRRYYTHFLDKHRSTIKPDEEWALVSATLVLLYYIGFLTLEVGTPGSHGQFSLDRRYLAANNYLLAALAIVLSIVLQRKDRREGLVSKVHIFAVQVLFYVFSLLAACGYGYVS